MVRYDTAVVAPANVVVRARGGSQKSSLTICQLFVFLIENEEKNNQIRLEGGGVAVIFCFLAFFVCLSWRNLKFVTHGVPAFMLCGSVCSMVIK